MPRRHRWPLALVVTGALVFLGWSTAAGSSRQKGVLAILFVAPVGLHHLLSDGDERSSPDSPESEPPESELAENTRRMMSGDR